MLTKWGAHLEFDSGRLLLWDDIVILSKFLKLRYFGLEFRMNSKFLWEVIQYLLRYGHLNDNALASMLLQAILPEYSSRLQNAPLTNL